MTTMTTQPQESWKDYFTTFSRKNSSANKHIDRFLEASTPSRDRDLKIDQISKDQGHSIMLYFSTATNSIHFLHSISNLGGTTWDPSPTLVALDGFSSKTAYPVLLDVDSLFQDVSTFAPTSTRLSVITNKEDLKTTEAPDKNPQKFKHLPFIMLPPLFWETATNLKNLSPANVFLEFSNCIETFITDNAEDEDLKVVTKNSCSNIFTFIWAAAHSKVTSVNIIPSGDIPEISAWAETQHRKCIIQVTDNQHNLNNNDIQRLSTVIESTQQANQSIINETISSSSEKKGFDKLDKSVKNLILNAASPNNEIAATIPPQTCSSFFKQSSHGNACLNFIRSTKTHIRCICGSISRCHNIHL